jgi:hypothetical protein
VEGLWSSSRGSNGSYWVPRPMVFSHAAAAHMWPQGQHGIAGSRKQRLDHPPLRGDVLLWRVACEPQVEDGDLAAAADCQVAPRDVAVHDAERPQAPVLREDGIARREQLMPRQVAAVASAIRSVTSEKCPACRRATPVYK